MKDTVKLPLSVSIFLSHFLKISRSAASTPLSSFLTFLLPLVLVSVHPEALVYLPLHDPVSVSILLAVKQIKRGKANFSEFICNINYSLQETTDDYASDERTSFTSYLSASLLLLSRIMQHTTPSANDTSMQSCINII